MSLHKISKTQRLKSNISSVWNIACSSSEYTKLLNAENFKYIQRNFLAEDTFYPGMILRIKIPLVLGIKLDWVSKISKVEPNSLVEHVLINGPFSVFVHRFELKEIAENEVEITDTIDYSVKFGFVGQLLNVLYFKNKINNLLEHRSELLHKAFNEE